MRRAAVIALLFSATGCDRTLADPQPPGQPMLSRSVAAAAPPPPTTATVVPLESEGSRSESAMAEALRKEDWRAAAEALDALGPELMKQPKLRYARARAAIELGEHAKALELVSGLEVELPSLADRILRLRAEAQLEAGPYDAAAAYFMQRRDARSLLRAGMAFRRAAKLPQARAALERALTTADKRRERELIAEIRAERAGLFEFQGDKARAATELRFLAIEMPLSDVARDADERLARLSPKGALTKSERAARLLTFAGKGWVEAVEREIQKLGATPGPALGRGKVAFARGFALYLARRDYARAAELLGTAAREGAPDPGKAHFYAARALARAHDDDRAIAAYRELSRRYPNTTWAEYGSYLIAKTQYAGGRFTDALTAYDTYLKRYGKRARFTTDASYERAVALLSVGRFAEAGKALEALRAKSTDAREVGRLLELEGAARAGAGERERAVELLSRAVTEQPLSFAALAATARLERMNAPVPPQLGAAGVELSLPPLSVQLPEPAALLSELGLDREAEAELLPREREIQGRHSSRGHEALCRAYGRLDVAERRYQVAQSAVASAVLQRAPSPATLWQWECIYPRPHEAVVREASRTHGVPEELLWSIMRQESGFRPEVVSPANAIGLMQLIPPTAERVAKEMNLSYTPASLRNPAYNVKLGSYYLKKLLDVFGGNAALAAAAYNAGPQAVLRWVEHARDLPLDVFVARIPYDETQGYVERVIGNHARYRYVQSGEAGIPKLALELPREIKPTGDMY